MKMDNKFRQNLMKIIALLSVFSFVYSGITLLKGAFYRNSPIVSELLIAVLILYLGFFIGKTVIRENSQRLDNILAKPFFELVLGKYATVSYATKLIAYLLMIVPFCIVIFMHSGESIFIRITEAVMALVLYFIGLRANFFEYGDIVGYTSFYSGLLFSIGVIFLSTYFERFYPFRSLFILLAFIAVISSMVVQNQANLDNMVMKKEAYSASAPKNIRSFNIKIIILFLVTVFLMLNLSSILAYVLNLLRMILGTVLGWIMDLFGYISTKGEGTQEITSPGMEFPFFGSQRLERPLDQLITNVMKYFILLYIAIKAIPILVKKLVELVKRVISLINRLLQNGLNNMSDAKINDYVDEIEIIKPSWLNKRKNGTHRVNRSKKALKKTIDPVQKIRHIYACITEMLIEKEVDIRASDTTGEILDKSNEIKGIERYFKKLTQVYNEVRYGHMIPDTDSVKEAEVSFNLISESIKRSGSKIKNKVGIH